MTQRRTASALVIDDEAPALDELSYLLRSTFSFAPVDAAQSPGDAFRYLQERSYDVVFLDVRMPALNGIELGNVLRRFAVPPAIVFVTAYEEYAVRAFDLGACDYLLKPVSRARLRTALGRALGPSLGPSLGRSPDQPDPPADDPSATIPVEIAGRTRFVHRDQVRWVEAEGDYVRLHTIDGSAYLVRMPISHLEERWSAYGFIRIHRGFLVPFKHITEFSVTNGVHAVTVAGQSLPVSRRHVRDVRDRILRAGRRSLSCPRRTPADPVRAPRRTPDDPVPVPRRSSRGPPRASPEPAVSWWYGGLIRPWCRTTCRDSVTCGTTPSTAGCWSGRSCARSSASPSCA
ncbi:MAG: LytR/AlgR family response regulator transcription factor [Streptosporangiaceae bacterium]